jgi:hypothetical protein
VRWIVPQAIANANGVRRVACRLLNAIYGACDLIDFRRRMRLPLDVRQLKTILAIRIAAPSYELTVFKVTWET